MGLSDNQELSDLDFDKVFIGSCTNSRIEDLREAAEVLKGHKVSENIQEAIVVPGSGMGRLIFDFVAEGYSTHGNEFSYYM